LSSGRFTADPLFCVFDSILAYKKRIKRKRSLNSANKEKKLPPYFINRDGFYTNKFCTNYLQPLVKRENIIRFSEKGYPSYFILGQ